MFPQGIAKEHPTPLLMINNERCVFHKNYMVFIISIIIIVFVVDPECIYRIKYLSLPGRYLDTHVIENQGLLR